MRREVSWLVAVLAISLCACSKHSAESDPADKTAATPATPTSAAPREQAANAGTVFYQNIDLMRRLDKGPKLSELIKRDKITEQTIICTVGDDAINVSDFKNAYDRRTGMIREAVKSLPSIAPLLEKAKKEGITLTEEEKKEFLDSARKNLGKDFEANLKEHKITEAQFDKDLLDMGLALKVGSQDAEKGLVQELVNRAILIDAARKAGLGKKAYNRYFEFKQTPKYKSIETLSEFTPLQLKEALVEGFLVEEMVEKINRQATVSDDDVRKYYDENKDQFKHPGRVRWSQIVIAAPAEDSGALQSIRTQIKAQMPALSDEELDKEVKKAEDGQKAKADTLLQKALAKADFAVLANENTDDLPVRSAKVGGDMGFTSPEEMKGSPLLAPLATALETIKVGEVYPKLIKSSFGFHIVKLTEQQPSGVLPYGEVKARLKDILKENNSKAVIARWLIEQRKKVPIKLTAQFESLIPPVKS